MDFYKYINSKDVAEHLKKLDFELKSHYCLWIILQNENLTLDEKTHALKQILMMPDYEFKKADSKSVHKLINEYFDYIEVIKQELIENDDNSFYTGFIDFEEHTSHLAIYFKDYESCLKHIQEKISNTERVVKGYQIHKIPFNTYENTIKAKYTGEILTSIHKCGGFNLATTLFWIAGDYVKLPCPFKPGDILYDLIEERIVVLESASTNEVSTICYYISDDEKSIVRDHFSCYTDLIYHNEELTGKDVPLYIISDFIKRRQCY